ncbi:hypothetical protein QAD02_016941 [Eretmocerus hayati]|uniref:Uncharacterized protein n=1 Tax=Eretmocerus hayati TaxID=131215 RepID=A0ACC2PF06_9HYME|nr:hypothetical protein QAD02_016941 [Eretmocerus hayati]
MASESEDLNQPRNPELDEEELPSSPQNSSPTSPSSSWPSPDYWTDELYSPSDFWESLSPSYSMYASFYSPELLAYNRPLVETYFTSYMYKPSSEDEALKSLDPSLYQKLSNLKSAVVRGDANDVKELLIDDQVKEALRKIIPGQKKTTLLHEAVKNGKREICEILLKHDEVDVNAVDEGGRSVLHHAVCHDRVRETTEYVQILQLLLSHGALLNNGELNNIYMLVRGVVECGTVEALHLFLGLGFKLNELNSWDKSKEKPPLHIAVCNPNTEILKYLLIFFLDSALFDVDAQDSTGNTALHEAVRLSHTEHMRLLLEWQADPDVRNFEDKKPIEDAIDKTCPASMEVLLFFGTNVSVNSPVPCLDYSERLDFPIPSFRWIQEQMIIHLALCEGRNYSINTYDESCMRELLSCRYYRNLAELYNKCIDEVRLLQAASFNGSNTFYDLLFNEGSTRCMRLLHTIDEEQVIDLPKRFPVYGKKVQQRIALASRMVELEEDAIRGLNHLFGINIESYRLVYRRILYFLCQKDLRALRAFATANCP